jgi:hypothetical protein
MTLERRKSQDKIMMITLFIFIPWPLTSSENSIALRYLTKNNVKTVRYHRSRLTVYLHIKENSTDQYDFLARRKRQKSYREIKIEVIMTTLTLNPDLLLHLT